MKTETKELNDLIIDSHSGGVHIQPELNASTADSTVFMFCGSFAKKEEFCLDTKEPCQNRGTNAVYNIDENDHIKGS